MKTLFTIFTIILSFLPFNNTGQMDKNQKLSQQLNGIYSMMHKYESILSNFKSWALANDGVIDAAETAKMQLLQNDVDAIKKRVEQVCKAKSLALEMLQTKTTAPLEEEEEAPAPSGSSSSTDGGLEVPMQEDNIPKGDLLSTCQQYLSKDSIASALGNVKDAKAMVDMTVFKQNLAKLSFSTPLGKEMHSKIQKGLEPLNGLIEAGQVTKIFNNIASEYTKESVLISHFKANQAIYNYDPESSKKKENTPTLKNQEELESSELILDIKQFLSIAGSLLYNKETVKEHSENLLATEDAKKAEKEKDEAAFREFKNFFSNGMNKEKDEIEAIQTLGDSGKLDVRIVDFVILQNNEAELTTAEFSKEMTKGIFKSLVTYVKSSSTLVSAAEVKQVAKTLITEYTSDKSLHALFQQYKAQPNMSVPTGFAGWINAACQSADLSSFEKNYKTEWADKVVGAVDSFLREIKGKGLNFKADRKLLDVNFKAILSDGLGQQNSQPGLDIHAKFMSLLPGDNALDYAVVDTAWAKTMKECSQKAFMQQLCEKYIVSGASSLLDISNDIDGIDTILPNVDAIVVALYNSRYYAAPLPKPNTKDQLRAKFSLSKMGREKQNMVILLDIPIRFEVQKGSNDELVYNPVPDLSISDFNIMGGFGYKVHAIKNVYKGPTVISGGNGILNSRTPFAWRLLVEDTSEQTVIQEPEVGELIMVDVNMGKLTGLEDVGLNPAGFQVKFVGNEYGHCDKILGTITIMGLPFIVGWGSEGPIGYFKNPMAFKEAELQYKYGAKTFDLYLSCEVVSEIGFDHSITINAMNGALGNHKGGFQPEDMKVDKFESMKVVVEKPGKVE